MRAKMRYFLAMAVLLIPCVCLAQTQSAEVTAGDVEPFLGSWSGQYEECRTSTDCEGRGVTMTITSDMVNYTLGAGTGGFAKHSKAGSAPSSKSYPAKYQKVNGVTTMSFTTSSGTVVRFTRQGGRLAGQGSAGRFNVKYTLTKGGM